MSDVDQSHPTCLDISGADLYEEVVIDGIEDIHGIRVRFGSDLAGLLLA